MSANVNKKEDKFQLDHRKELIRLIQKLSSKYGVWRVFEDFLAMAAISISNAVDLMHRGKREAQYMEIVGRYEKSEVELFSQMFAHLVEELEQHAEHPTDILGTVFHELELHNKYKGQFFTPQDVCDMMGMITCPDGPIVDEKGYVTVCEPCSGSGAMILAFAKAMKKNSYDYHRQLVVTAMDIDLKCVYMSYLQLSLYGIPAVVIHGNTITVEEWSRWYTPVYMLDGWAWRQKCGNLDKRYPEDEAIKRASDPLYAAIRSTCALTKTEIHEQKEAPTEPVTKVIQPVAEYKENKMGQLALF